MPLYRNAYVLTLNHGINSVLGLLYWVLAARLLPPDVVGSNAAVIALLLFASYVSQLGLRSAMIWYLARAVVRPAKAIRVGYLLSVVVSLFAGSVLLVAFPRLDPSLRMLVDVPALALWFVLSTALWSVFSIQDGVLTGLGHAVWIPVANLAYGVGKLILLTFLAGTAAPLAIFLSWTVAVPLVVVVVNVLIAFVVLPARPRSGDSGAPRLRTLVAFLTGDYAGEILSEAAARLLPAIVISAAGAAATAFYYQAWMVATPLALVASAMAASLTVEGAADREQADAYSRTMLIHMFQVLVPVALAVMVLAPLILEVFGSAYALEGTTLLRILALAALPACVMSWFFATSRIHNRLRGMLVSQAVFTGTVLLAAIALVPRLGIVGAGLAWLAGRSLVAVMIVAFAVFPLFRPNKRRT